jgi:xanthine dehydrogenase molybdopterin-binding subunit B
LFLVHPTFPLGALQETVTCVGQAIGIVVGETEAAARNGVRAVQVTYEDLPAVLDIDDAIEAASYYEGWGHVVEAGDVDAVFSSPDEHGIAHVFEGEVRMGGQVRLTDCGSGA